MTRNEFKTENSGENQGVIVGQNSGNINVSIQKVVKIPSLIATVVKTLGEMCLQPDKLEPKSEKCVFKMILVII